MANLVTNRGLFLRQRLALLCQDTNGGYVSSTGGVQTRPVNWYYALVTSATPPTKDTNTLSGLTPPSSVDYPAGGYAFGAQTSSFTITKDPSGTDLPSSRAVIKDVFIPAPVTAAIVFRYVLITDDAATIANRQVFESFDMLGDITIAIGSSKTLQAGTLEVENA